MRAGKKAAITAGCSLKKKSLLLYLRPKGTMFSVKLGLETKYDRTNTILCWSSNAGNSV